MTIRLAPVERSVMLIGRAFVSLESTLRHDVEVSPMDVQAVADEFEANGCAVVRGVFSADEIARLATELAEFIERVAPTLPQGDIFYEDSAARPIKSMFRMDQRSDYFRSLLVDPRLLGLMEAIFPDGPVVRDYVAYFGKPARQGSVAPAHQDNAFQCWEPPESLIATLAIDQSTPENGALICQRGSHKLGVLPHRPSGVLGFSQMLVEPVSTDLCPEVQMCMQPGDLCLHHINCIHRSDANHTDRPRRQLAMGYRSARAKKNDEAARKYRADLDALYQQQTK
jgi:ectoine hydroxylase-related dioxygenase (phytanoyl-CoA dioxygenase family)